MAFVSLALFEYAVLLAISFGRGSSVEEELIGSRRPPTAWTKPPKKRKAKVYKRKE